MRKEYRRYDHRLRNMIARSGSIDDLLNLKIPKSTLKSWIKNGPKDYFKCHCRSYKKSNT